MHEQKIVHTNYFLRFHTPNPFGTSASAWGELDSLIFFTEKFSVKEFFKWPLLTVDHYTAFFTPVPGCCYFFCCDFSKVISFFTVDFKTFRAVIT